MVSEQKEVQLKSPDSEQAVFRQPVTFEKAVLFEQPAVFQKAVIFEKPVVFEDSVVYNESIMAAEQTSKPASVRQSEAGGNTALDRGAARSLPGRVPAAMQVRNLSFSYGDHPVLDGLSLEIPAGRISVLMGANGCGKTTLFRVMTKGLRQQQGQVLLEDRDISGLRLREFSERVAIVHQNNTAPPDLTVEKLVSYGRTPYLSAFGGGGEQDREAVLWAMEETNVTKHRNRRVSALSGGQRQRVWIAMALAQKTDVLFLDEPTTYLDIRYQVQILRLIRQLNREYGITIVMVLHDINQAVEYSDVFVGMKDGRIEVCGNPYEVVTTRMLNQLYGIDLEIARRGGRKFVLTI